MDKTEEKNVLTIENLESLFSAQQSNVDKAVKATLSDFSKQWDSKFASYRVDKGPEKPATVEDPKPEAEAEAELSDMSLSKTFGKVTDFEVWGVPLGAALVGGFVGIFATELVDGYLKNQSVMVRGGVKLVGAGVIAKFLPKYLGKELCYTVALLMAFDGLKNDIMPSIFGYATTWANKLTGTTTVAGLGWTGGPPPTAPQSALAARRDYYSASGLG
jgi:hypothetical protein